MTLIEYRDVAQGSAEWHDLRRGTVTASAVGRLLTAKTFRSASNDDSRALTALLVAERITARTEPTWTSADMLRGVLHEPVARAYYAERHAPVTEVGFMLRTEDDWDLGFSPDGLVGESGLLEIKCPRARTHISTILAGEVPAHYMAQCQAGLLVSGRKWLDFASFSSGLPLWVKRVEPDEHWFNAIVAAVQKFEQNAADMVARYRDAVVGLPMTEYIADDLELVI